MTLKEARWLVENAFDEAEAKSGYQVCDKVLRSAIIGEMMAVVRKAVEVRKKHASND